jgi:hypothetical protein
MIVARFDPELHLDAINGWMLARGRGQVPLSMCPQEGRVVPGVAAGFLYQTDSDTALLDHFVSNPEAPFDERQAAMDTIADALIHRAGELGFHNIVAMTKSAGIRDRALRMGFRDAGNSCILVKETRYGLC